MKLNKCLYGLTNAGRLFHLKIRRELVEDWGFRASAADPCLFVKTVGRSQLRVLLFVDDMMMTWDRDVKGRLLYEQFRRDMDSKYNFSRADNDNVYLGFAVHRTSATSLFLTQSGYIKTVMRKYGFDKREQVQTPAKGDLKVSVEDCFKEPVTKAYVYDTHRFVVVRARDADKEIDTEFLCVFVTDELLVTVRHSAMPAVKNFGKRFGSKKIQRRVELGC